jgi:LuxR family quorum-sensing system transcriptional regulator SolR
VKCWQSDQLQLVISAKNVDHAFQSILSEINRLGFAYGSFGMKSPVPMVAPRVIWCSNYPETWKQCYEAKGYLRQDPTVAHAIVSDEALRWSDELFASCPELRADAKLHGLVHGMAQPQRDASGMVSLLSCVRQDPPVSDEEFAAKRERVQWLSHLCHESMARHWGASLRGVLAVELTEREIEVLRWSCDGKTSADIAQIMHLAEATVTFHLRNACTKLGASNRTAAAVRAALLGMLW